MEEIVLLGQIVNKHPDFAQILRQVSDLEQVRRLRYTSPYPTYYSDEIFALHQERENICPHIHMPLQAGSDAVLKKMFRGYTSAEYMEFVKSIRALDRPISITTDIIVGFCDETEEDFQQSLGLVEQSRFDMIYIGIYSPRPGTYGAKKYEDNIPLEVKKSRHARLNDLLRTISDENNLSEIDQQRTMMIREINDTHILGYTEHMKNIMVPVTIDKQKTHQVGEFIDVVVTDTKAFNLYGKIV